MHPRGGCGFAGHGTYPRVRPRGARVARWYCRVAHQTFSLLPDCLAARLPGTLEEVEDAVVSTEQAKSLEAAADGVRPDIELPGALRWLRRRVARVHAALSILRGIEPERFGNCRPTLSEFRACLDVVPVLSALREMASASLADLPAPLGFRPRLASASEYRRARQHNTGTDPPPSSR